MICRLFISLDISHDTDNGNDNTDNDSGRYPPRGHILLRFYFSAVRANSLAYDRRQELVSSYLSPFTEVMRDGRACLNFFLAANLTGSLLLTVKRAGSLYNVLPFAEGVSRLFGLYPFRESAFAAGMASST